MYVTNPDKSLYVTNPDNSLYVTNPDKSLYVTNPDKSYLEITFFIIQKQLKIIKLHSPGGSDSRAWSFNARNQF